MSLVMNLVAAITAPGRVWLSGCTSRPVRTGPGPLDTHDNYTFCQFAGTSLGEIPPEAVIFGRSEVMQALRDRMDKVASANVPVLIQGESGTGKDIIARMIHGLSPWRTGPSSR